MLQARLLCYFFEPASRVFKETYRHILTADNKIGFFIIVEVGEDGGGYHTGIFKPGTYLPCDIGEPAMIVLQKITARDAGVAGGRYPACDKNIGVAIAIVISHGYCLVDTGDRCRDSRFIDSKVALAIIYIKPWPVVSRIHSKLRAASGDH